MVDDNDDGDDDGVELGVSKLIDDHPAGVFRVGARSVFYGSGHMGRHRPIYESSGLELPFWGCWRPILWEHCANAFVLDNFWTTSGKLSDKLWMTFVCLFPVLLRLKYDNAKIADGYPQKLFAGNAHEAGVGRLYKSQVKISFHNFFSRARDVPFVALELLQQSTHF